MRKTMEKSDALKPNQAGRDLNLDLIRCVAILHLLGIHFIAGTGWYALPNTDVLMALVNILRALFITCVALFLFLSGYLCSKKELSARYYLGLVRIYVIYILACIPCLLVKALYLHEPMDLHYVLGSIVNHYACDYSWYVSMYTGLFLMIPFLNLAYNGLRTRRQKLVLVWTFIFLGNGPSLLNIKHILFNFWFRDFYPLAYYFIGAYFREYRPRIRPRKALLLLLAAATAAGLVNFFYSRPDIFLWESFIWPSSFESLIVGCLVFILYLNLDLSRCPAWLSRAISTVSMLSFPVFLLSYVTDTLSHPLLRSLIASPMQRFWLMVPWILGSLGVTMLMAYVLNLIAKPAIKGLCALLTRPWRSLNKAKTT